MVLRGSEVKSLRESQVQMTEAYGRIDDGELYLLGLNISPYASTGSASSVSYTHLTLPTNREV